MTTFTGMLNIIERDDAVLIGENDDPSNYEDFAGVEVQLDDGVVAEDINGDQVAMLQSNDNKKIRFIRIDPTTLTERYDDFNNEGWMVVGFEMVRYYPTVVAWMDADCP